MCVERNEVNEMNKPVAKFGQQTWRDGTCKRCERQGVQVNAQSVCKKCFLK